MKLTKAQIEAKRDFVVKGNHIVNPDCPVVIKSPPDDKPLLQRIAELHARTEALLRPVRS